MRKIPTGRRGVAMGVTVWIVLAFVVGIVFGRLTARGSGARPGTPDAFGGRPGAATDTAPRILGSPGGSYRVVLLDSGPNKINTIKAVRESTRVGLKDAKDLAEAAPCELIRVETPSQAEEIARRFQGVATVRVEGPRMVNQGPEAGSRAEPVGWHSRS